MNNNGTIEIFALTEEQTALLYSFQREKIIDDIKNEKNMNKRDMKRKWLTDWVKSIKNVYKEISSGNELEFSENLLRDFKSLAELSANKTWCHLVVLETEFFYPYFPLNEKSKQYKQIKYTSKNFVYSLLTRQTTPVIVKPSFVDTINKTYRKTLNKLNGTTSKIITSVATTVAVSALTFGAASLLAGPIAVALVGSQFSGLAGAALTNACLAYIGGGAIAVGGLGMAGGTAIIAGGGALIGLATGGSISTGVTAAIIKNPQLAISSIAKLEVVMKEIILNAQHDVASAQKILSQYKEKIRQVEDEIEELRLKNEKYKKDIENMKKTLEFFKKSYAEMRKYTSSFEIGLKCNE
ncbi:MAG: coiled-coil domain-containing protein 22 [Oscillospiraceae bacterium]|nr:coiled-coil domain-containing protein 22 [Oscillospiraceae bacterium]